jgi:hypothetical protein
MFVVLLLLGLTRTADSNYRFHQDQGPTQAQIQRRQEHSNLYNGHGSFNLRELAAKTKPGEEVFVSQVCSMTAVMPDAPPFDLFSFLSGLSCNADAIVIGVIRDKASFLTDDDRYVFTDYTLTVDEVLKDDSVFPIELRSDIVVTRPCGTITLEGRTVRVTDVAVASFEQGRRYVLLLKRIPNAGTYGALSSQSGFELRDGQVLKTTEVFLGMESQNGEADFLSKLRIAAGNPCKHLKSR